MSSQPTARDAVWGSILGVDRTDDTDAVLAALGIPADAPTDDIKAGLLFLRHPTWRAEQDYRGGHWFAYDHERIEEPAGIGGSRATAVLALAAKLEAS